jgi:Tfp pilus assembly protein PilF
VKAVLISFILLAEAALAQQQPSFEQWEKESRTNIRLLPKYGHQPKTEDQKKADLEFTATALKADTTSRKASDHLIRLGFNYLYTDIRTAMYRFNQAWLLDSANSDVYWGFGAIYMTLGNYGKAKEQYTEGLKLSPGSAHLLTDYGTYFMAQYYALQPILPSGAQSNLDSALTYFGRSYAADPKDQNTLFKLSVAYWNKGDCESAWNYYDECMKNGGAPITANYTKDLKKKCRRKKK